MQLKRKEKTGHYLNAIKRVTHHGNEHVYQNNDHDQIVKSAHNLSPSGDPLDRVPLAEQSPQPRIILLDPLGRRVHGPGSAPTALAPDPEEGPKQCFKSADDAEGKE